MRKGQKLAVAGATVFLAEPVLALMHTGGAGVLVGLTAGAVAYLVADEFKKSSGDTPPDDNTHDENDEKKLATPGQHSLAHRLLVGKSVRGEAGKADARQPADQAAGLPRRSPTFAEMKHLIKPGRVILGYDGQKFISGEAFSQVVNIAIIGLPRHGKSTCLRFHMAQALVEDAIIRGWDTHGDVAGEFGDYLSFAETAEAILADCDWINQELERRADLFKRYRRHDPQAEREWDQTRPLVYIIDEFFLLLTVHIKTKAERDIVASTLLNLIGGASKYKCRVVLSGQALPANIFGDQASSIRDIIGTKYAFASEDRQARMVGISEQAIKELLPLIAGEKIRGYSIVAGSPLTMNKIISIPDTTFRDIQELLDEGDDYEDDPGLEGSEDDLPEGITEDDLDQIVAAYEAGGKLPDIAALVQMDLRTFKVACELVGIEAIPAQPRTPFARVPDTDTARPDAPVKLMPKPAVPGKPKADYPDAVKVWNELGPIGRPRLKKALEDRGFECSDDLAKKLLARIEDALKEQAGEAGGGGAVAGGGGE